ncbi:hypothetical protein BV22DRAFT_971978, partial [Leucogyrophana mollusca]
FPVVAAILRISHSSRSSMAQVAQFANHRASAIEYLERRWPSDLRSLTLKVNHFAVETVILGRQCNIPSVLKRAFYELLRSSGFGLSSDGGVRLCIGTSDLEMDRWDERRMVSARSHLQIAW